MDAVSGDHAYAYPSEHMAELKLHRPSVTLHETATPLPTILRLLRAGSNVQPDNFFKLEPFPNYISKQDYRPVQDSAGSDVWLEDGDLNLGNVYANDPKAELWVHDLAATRNGIGIYLANSRGEQSGACLLSKQQNRRP